MDMLFIFTHYISYEQYEKYEQDKNSMEIKSEISHYISYLKTMGGTPSEGEWYPIEREKELLSYISLGDYENAYKVVSEIMARMYIGYGMNFSILKSRVLELLVLLSRASLKGGAEIEEIFGLNYSYINEVNSLKNIDELTSWINDVTKRFCNCVFKFKQAKHTDSIYKAIQKIKENYMNKIKLEDVAKSVHFTKTYFSRIFKEEVGITFNRYLNNTRVNASKQLLKEKDISLSDVAAMAGFYDQSHFTKTFKDITGISPKQFRDNIY
jgi:YesN/AraC family two-component response regulator